MLERRECLCLDSAFSFHKRLHVHSSTRERNMGTGTDQTLSPPEVRWSARPDWTQTQTPTLKEHNTIPGLHTAPLTTRSTREPTLRATRSRHTCIRGHENRLHSAVNLPLTLAQDDERERKTTCSTDPCLASLFRNDEARLSQPPSNNKLHDLDKTHQRKISETPPPPSSPSPLTPLEMRSKQKRK